jgi:hypothetical protein
MKCTSQAYKKAQLVACALYFLHTFVLAVIYIPRISKFWPQTKLNLVGSQSLAWFLGTYYILAIIAPYSYVAMSGRDGGGLFRNYSLMLVVWCW